MPDWEEHGGGGDGKALELAAAEPGRPGAVGMAGLWLRQPGRHPIQPDLATVPRRARETGLRGPNHHICGDGSRLTKPDENAVRRLLIKLSLWLRVCEASMLCLTSRIVSTCVAEWQCVGNGNWCKCKLLGPDSISGQACENGCFRSTATSSSVRVSSRYGECRWLEKAKCRKCTRSGWCVGAEQTTGGSCDASAGGA